MAVAGLLGAFRHLALSSFQAMADEMTANEADTALPDRLARAVAQSGAATTDARTTAALRWLTSAEPRVDSDSALTAEWKVVGHEGAEIRVDVYMLVESGDLLPPTLGKSTWGLACRVYDVSDGVHATTVQCPVGTPDAPTSCALGDNGQILC